MKAIFAMTLVSLTSVAAAQRLVLPDNHNLMESPTYGNSTGDTTYWRTTAGRFQVLYEASHFLGAGRVPGPITLTNVRFRGEDGESNLGGQVYTGVVVELGATSLTSAAGVGGLTTTFGSPTGGGPGTAGSNRDPAVTTLSGAVTVTVTLTPSVGSCPNNYMVDIDVSSLGFVFDPTSARPNLLIDITMPTAPANAAPLSLLPTQDTIAHGLGIRGRSITTATFAGLTGTNDTTPPIVGLQFLGAGGSPTEVPAKAEYIGAGCGGSPSTVYQEFYQDQAFDIAGGFTLTPDVYPNPNTYTMTAGAGAFDLTQLNAVPDTTLDDTTLTAALVDPTTLLPWTFSFPGGSTGSIEPSTNGFIWLDTTMTATDFTVSRTLMLGSAVVAGDNGPRLMPLWLDMTATKNTGLNPLAGLHIKQVGETSPGAADAKVYVTWRDMGTFRIPGSATVFGHAIWNVQCCISQNTGIVEYRYGPCQPFFSALGGVYTNQTAAGIVGFTRGRIGGIPSVDPGSRDLSDPGLLPYTTSVEGASGHVLLTATATPIAGTALQTPRMFAGQTLTYTVANVPPPVGLSLAILSFDVGPPILSFPLFGLSPAGCTTAFPAVFPAIFNFASALNVSGGTLPIAPPLGPVPAHNAPLSWATLGLPITAQAWVADFGAPFIVPAVSNTIKYVVGLD